ncbi:peptidoglycan-binding protein [Desulfovibrio sp. OttesenSCG-928-C14]|nr:peptidoglycan-binding protein [Desulfovibrio sp. OttesenSCG-928-C14]
MKKIIIMLNILFLISLCPVSILEAAGLTWQQQVDIREYQMQQQRNHENMMRQQQAYQQQMLQIQENQLEMQRQIQNQHNRPSGLNMNPFNIPQINVHIPPPAQIDFSQQLNSLMPPPPSIQQQMYQHQMYQQQQAQQRQLVIYLQKVLTKAGYNPGPVDGIAGPRTAGALQAFARDRGITDMYELAKAVLRAGAENN